MRTDPITQPESRSACHRLAIVAIGAVCTLGVLSHPAYPATSSMGVHQDGATYMVVDREDTPLRCGDQDVFYAIARLKKGTVLQTAGESGAYTMVVMPDSIGALVPATEVESPQQDTVTLRVESKLRAPSQLMGISGSWKQLYTTALPAGTELTVLERLTNEAGSVVGYRVRAPRSPSGEMPLAYIQTDTLRPALSSEIDGAETDAGADDTGTVEEQGESLPETEDTSGTETTLVTEPEEVDTSLLEDKVTEQPVEITNTTPQQDDSSEPAIRVADEGRIPTSELEDLESAFKNARSMPREELDEALGELLAEFTRTRDEAGDDESLARALDQRIEWLKIRIETRDQRRRIAQALAEYDSGADQTAQAIEAWQRGRAYQLVGRMVTSSVYTGANLPLLYRVQGTDPITGQPRTVGYVAPKKDQDLRHMLGRVVGVLGVMREDAALGLRVVEPERVDLMPE